MALVLVTGATGFIGSHVIKSLQEEGYRVRGTVRSLSNQERLQPLYDICPDAQYKLELVEADLLKPEGWKEAVDGCTYVLHVASPFPMDNVKDEEIIIGPAREGTKNVLEACTGSSVKRVVVTSSIAAIITGRKSTEKDTYTEEDWGEEAGAGAYLKSKIIAERLAWKYVEDLPADQKFELAVVNPGFVLGPPLLKNADSSSIGFPKRLLERQMPMVPNLHFSIVDVRDVAAGHIAAMTSPEAVGHRHILVAQGMWFKQMAIYLDNHFRSMGYRVPTTSAPNCMMRIASWFDGAIKMILPFLGEEFNLSNERFVKVLGVNPRSVESTVVEMAHKCIELGYIKKTAAYQAPN